MALCFSYILSTVRSEWCTKNQLQKRFSAVSTPDLHGIRDFDESAGKPEGLHVSFMVYILLASFKNIGGFLMGAS